MKTKKKMLRQRAKMVPLKLAKSRTKVQKKMKTKKTVTKMKLACHTFRKRISKMMRMTRISMLRRLLSTRLETLHRALRMKMKTIVTRRRLMICMRETRQQSWQPSMMIVTHEQHVNASLKRIQRLATTAIQRPSENLLLILLSSFSS